ncbi:MAG: glycosyltransferase family 39 protein, partial [Propionibacteriaceae bacterium]|nr:glycosyltransferase family 39 protein [Propionibacteriaceae bacterium]
MQTELDPPISSGPAGTAPPGPSQHRRDGVARGSLIALLVATGVLYIWGLSASGWANSFYSAAAQAGSQDWTAWFFGSLDAGNAITVDKPPASIWLMALSVRLFGLSSWSILVPQALLGVGSVALLYAALRRSLLAWRTAPGQTHSLTDRGTHWAALLGAAVLALTPVAALMFRFNNPDALLVFTMVLASYLTVRAAETGSRGWLALAGVAIGLGFLTKMLQAFLVLPALAIAYFVAAPRAWRRKLVDLLVAFAAVLVSAGWYVAIVELMPASMRPYIGGSQTNSLLELILSYNGL